MSRGPAGNEHWASPRYRPAGAVVLVFFVLIGATMLRRQFTDLRATA